MKLPIRRGTPHNQDTPAVHGTGEQLNHDRMTAAFTSQLDRWPDFFQPFNDVLRSVLPLADVEESAEAYVVDIELPGVKREDVSVEVTDDHLVVKGERRERERVGLLRQQTRSIGRFHYEVTLPSGVDTDAVRASLDNGVLNVVVPKVESARPRKIAIATSSEERTLTG